MEQKSPQILNRESWLKVGVIALFSLVIVYKIFNSPLDIDFGEFKFSDLLAMLLSFFAIGMSVAFYFKATDTSNQFYNNSYKFTKEMSEILGRIEAGFGERLKHLDEGYLGLREKFDNFPVNTSKAEEAVEKEKETVAKIESERQKLIEDLALRAELQSDEKTKLFSELRRTESQLIEAKKELLYYKHKTIPTDDNQIEESMLPRILVDYIRRNVFDALGGFQEIAHISFNAIQSRFNVNMDNFDKEFIKDCILNNLVINGELTPAGAKYIRKIARREEINDKRNR